MKTIITLSLLVLPFFDSTETFWQQFKTAVSKHDVETIARLSSFPIEMPYGISNVKTKAQLARRYRRVFNEQTDAVACFSKKKPEIDTENPKHFIVVCPNEAGDDVLVYHFSKMKTGWKFTGFDNINE